MFHKGKAILSISEISSSDVTVRMRIYLESNAISGYQNKLPRLVPVSDGIGLGSIFQLSGKGSKVLLNILIWASTRQNLSSGIPTKRDSNPSPQLQRLARKLKFRL